MNVKNILWAATIIIAMVLAGCTSNRGNQQYEEVEEGVIILEPEPETREEPITEIKTEEEIIQEGIIAVLDPYANFTSTWARTDAHFFFSRSEWQAQQPEYILYRLPFNNIAYGEQIKLPGEGEIEILGLNNDYIFISRWNGEWNLHGHDYDIYRISLLTLEAELIDTGTYFGVPFFHLASNSIIFSHGDFEGRRVWLEALDLNNGTRHTFYEFNSDNFESGTGWRLMENDAALFINSGWYGVEPYSDFILIDRNLQGVQIQLEDIYGMPAPEPQNPGEEFIFGLGALWHSNYVTIDGWVYYLWAWDVRQGNLNRIRLDGTQNMLVEENTGIASLLKVNNTLFGTVYTETPYEDAPWYEAVKFSYEEDFSVAKVLGGGWHGHNSALILSKLTGTDMVMVVNASFFRVDGHVQALYCTESGALFTLYDR
ncbi:MAG: hypothetical protein FWE24_03845 [Defluviitaleaceae bacterium]|nr:hypothetical protein [Defluviitaleaceae bacterium]